MTEDLGKPLADDIPLSVAWVDGRRVYIVCGKGSQLGQELFELGASWDKVVRARYVGTQRRAVVEPLVRAHLERLKAAEHMRTEGTSSGWMLAIPFLAADIRAAAKEAGAVWAPEEKKWIFPDEQSLQAIAEQVKVWEAAQPAQTGQQKAGRARSSERCAECGRRGASVEAVDSSGIPGLVCERCGNQPSYMLSFA